MHHNTSGRWAASTLSALLRLRCSARSEPASLRLLRCDDMRCAMGLRGRWRRPAESGPVDSTAVPWSLLSSCTAGVGVSGAKQPSTGLWQSFKVQCLVSP